MRTIPRVAALLGLAVALLALPLPARPAAVTDGPQFTTDPRLELLGVLQQLAGLRPDSTPSDSAYRLRLEKRFKPWREHRAVAAYAKALKAQGSDPFGIIMLFHGPPPALSRRNVNWEEPFMDRFADPKELESTLQAFRDFAQVSRFMDYYQEELPARKRLEDLARKEAIDIGTMKDAAAYMGYTLPMRHQILLCVHYVPGQANNHIIPYPSRSAASQNRPKDVPLEIYSLKAPVSFTDGLLRYEPTPEQQEILYAYVETDFLSLELSDAAKRYGPISEGCKQNWSPCAMDLIVRSVEARFNERARRVEEHNERRKRPPEDRFMPALSASLREYEAHRDRYPTLRSYYSRLFEVFSGPTDSVERSAEDSAGRAARPKGSPR